MFNGVRRNRSRSRSAGRVTPRWRRSPRPATTACHPSPGRCPVRPVPRASPRDDRNSRTLVIHDHPLVAALVDLSADGVVVVVVGMPALGIGGIVLARIVAAGLLERECGRGQARDHVAVRHFMQQCGQGDFTGRRGNRQTENQHGAGRHHGACEGDREGGRFHQAGLVERMLANATSCGGGLLQLGYLARSVTLKTASWRNNGFAMLLVTRRRISLPRN